MGAESTLRTATESHAEAVQEVARESWHAAYGQFIEPDQIDRIIDEWYAPERLIADDISQPSRPFFVALIEEAVVGFAEAVPENAEHGIAQLYRIYVAPEYWNQGIGQRLLERIHQELTERGFDRLNLSVFAENNVGVRFYEAMGFERIDSAYSDEFGSQEYEYTKRL